MSEIEIKLTGWKAVAALAVAVALVGWRYYRVQTTLDEGATELVKTQVVMHELRRLTAPLEGADLENLTADQTQELLEGAQRLNKVEVKSLSARGVGEEIIVRAEVLVDGKPSDGRSVRYFLMGRSELLGWHMMYEVSRWRYYMELW